MPVSCNSFNYAAQVYRQPVLTQSFVFLSYRKIFFFVPVLITIGEFLHIYKVDFGNSKFFFFYFARVFACQHFPGRLISFFIFKNCWSVKKEGKSNQSSCHEKRFSIAVSNSVWLNITYSCQLNENDKEFTVQPNQLK